MSVRNHRERSGAFSEGNLVLLNGAELVLGTGRVQKPRQICNKKVSRYFRLIEMNQWLSAGELVAFYEHIRKKIMS